MQGALHGAELKAHIAQVAARLFYRDGVHRVGVDRIADEAQITKRTLYHHYASKDELIAAALRNAPIVEFPHDGSPVERIVGAFRNLKTFLTSTDYRGCPYIIFTAELVERRHPARQIIERRMERRRAWFRDLAERAGAADPGSLGEQLDVLFDGALASSSKRHDLKAADAAIAAASLLLSLATNGACNRVAVSDALSTCA